MQQRVLQVLASKPEPPFAPHADAVTKTGFDFNLLRILVAQDVNNMALGSLLTAAADSVIKHNGLEAKRLFGIDPRRTVPGLAGKIEAFRNSNVLLIQSMAADQVKKVQTLLEAPKNIDLSVEELSAVLQKEFGILESRADLIAADQILKLNGQVTQDRQQSAGIEQYVWTTSLDERVRPTHRALEGKVFSWNAPPPEGPPGFPIRCRCTAFPILEELDIVE